MKRLLPALALLMAMSAPAQAGQQAIAMTGVPLYPAGFTHMDYANAGAPKGGALKMARIGTFDNLNSSVIFGNAVEGLDLISDKLMQRGWNEPFTLYSLVAESVDVSPDRSTITFHLNPKARFHDGVPMTAEDVQFSFEMLKKYGMPVRRRVYGQVSEVKITSPHDITFTFGKEHDREAVMILALLPVLPKHYWEQRDVSKTTLEPPLGSGPYRIKLVEPGRKIVYERVKDYWAKDLPINKGLYNFDTITYSYYRDDSVALESFKAGDYNLRVEGDIHKWMTAYDFKAFDDGRVVKEEIPFSRPDWLRSFIFNTRRPQFEDRRVREALGLMFDFDWINKNLFFGALHRTGSTFPNSPLAAAGAPEGEEKALLEKYKKDLPPEVFGPAWQPPTGDMRERQRQAVKLLKEAGWVYKDQELVDAKTGVPFTFEILLGDPAQEKVALAFTRALKKIGIAARVRVVDAAQFTGRLEDYDYDMVLFQVLNSLSPGNEQANYWSSKAAANKGSRNYAGVMNPAVDAMAEGIAHAEDYKALTARAHALDRALMWGYYMIPLQYLGRDLVAHAADLKHPEVTPIYGIAKEAWWQDQGR